MRIRIVLCLGSIFMASLSVAPAAWGEGERARIALFGLAHGTDDAIMSSVAATVADTIELTLWLLGRYDLGRLPPVDSASDLPRIRQFCGENRVDQAICGSAEPGKQGGFVVRLSVYDRQKDSICLACDGTAASSLEIFAMTDALVSSLLDVLSGSHIELGSLEVETDPPGAVVSVNGREVGLSPLVLRSVPAGPLQLVARAEKHQDATATVHILDGVTEHTMLSPAPFPGSISVVTDIPGAHAMLDQERTLSTPCVFDDVPPGEHRISVFPVMVGRRYFKCESTDAVRVSPGERTVVSRTLTEDRAKLTILDAPPGSILRIDGAPVDRSVLAEGLQVPAGILDLELEAPSGLKWTKTTILTSQLNSASNGSYSMRTDEMTLQVPRRTIRIDGKIDDWRGLEPVWRKTPSATDLCPKQPGTLILRGFVCRDERFLYLRYDFEDGTPNEKLSEEIPHRLDYSARIYLSPYEEICIGVCTDRVFWGSQQARYLGIHRGGSFRDLGSGLEAKVGEGTLEIAVPLSPILRSLANQALDTRLFVALVRPDGTWQKWVESSTQVINFGN